MRQSSGLPPRLPAYLVTLILGLAGVLAPSLNAQEPYRVVSTENFRRDASPNSPMLARVSSGTELRGVPTGGDWIGVTLEGWIWSASVRPTNQGVLNLRVMSGGGENLRGTPNGVIVARVSEGTYLDEVSRDGNWVRVRR